MTLTPLNIDSAMHELVKFEMFNYIGGILLAGIRNCGSFKTELIKTRLAEDVFLTL